MTQPFADRPGSPILWGQVSGLAAVQGAIALLWVIYNLYLGDLLTRLGFPATLAAGLLVVENLLAIVMEPLMGTFSDRLQHQMGTRFPLVSLGVILAAGTFVGIPAIALGGVGTALRWSLPLMAIAWALAMTVFRSPALSLLGRYAIGTQLPQAASILTLVGGVAGAMGPLASDKILSLGPMVAFGLGSVILLMAAAVLGWVGPNASVNGETSPDATAPAQPVLLAWKPLGLVFGAGVGITFGFRLLLVLFSRALNSQGATVNASLVMGSIFIALALTAIPAGALAVRLGNRRAMVFGLAGMALAGSLVGSLGQGIGAIALALLFGAAFSLVSNGTIPFALSMVPNTRAGLGTGIFFGGAAAASAMFGAIADTLKGVPLNLGAVLVVLALLLAGICIAMAPRRGVVPSS